MRRRIWVVLGVTVGTVGIVVARRLSRSAQWPTPSGLSSGVQQFSEAVREFAADVRAAMAEQETALRAGAGFDATSGQAAIQRGEIETG